MPAAARACRHDCRLAAFCVTSRMGRERLMGDKGFRVPGAKAQPCPSGSAGAYLGLSKCASLEGGRVQLSPGQPNSRRTACDLPQPN